MGLAQGFVVAAKPLNLLVALAVMVAGAVTGLSPYLTHGFVGLPEVLAGVADSVMGLRTKEVTVGADEDGVAVVTLDRPDKLNSLNPELVCRLADAWAQSTLAAVRESLFASLRPVDEATTLAPAATISAQVCSSSAMPDERASWRRGLRALPVFTSYGAIL